jgi:hypothetical protein
VADINYIGCVPTRKSNRLCRSVDMFPFKRSANAASGQYQYQISGAALSEL